MDYQNGSVFDKKADRDEMVYAAYCLMSRGWTNDQIASELGLTEKECRLLCTVASWRNK